MIKQKAINLKISLSSTMPKYKNAFSNKLLNKYISGLIKKLTNGISKAMEIDSDNEENIERTNTNNN